jgi:hypothetical protein
MVAIHGRQFPFSAPGWSVHKPLDKLGALTHSTPLRVILSLPTMSQPLSLSNGSLSKRGRPYIPGRFPVFCFPSFPISRFAFRLPSTLLRLPIRGIRVIRGSVPTSGFRHPSTVICL